MINSSLLIRCANSFKRISELSKISESDQKELSTAITLLKSTKSGASGLPVQQGMLQEIIGMIETCQKLIKKNDKKSAFLIKKQLSGAATRCRVVVDLK